MYKTIILAVLCVNLKLGP